jgi:hypothetical protein
MGCGYANVTNMEMIALTTAMADARAAIQAASRGIQNYKRQVLATIPISPQNEAASEINETLEACDDMLAVVQVHLAYLVRPNSILVVPGTNAENSGTIFFI